MIDPLLKVFIAKRTCLKCGNKFDSVGPQNRICSICVNINRGNGRGSKNPMNNLRRGGIRNET